MLYVNHDSGEKAWFKRREPGTLRLSTLGYSSVGAAAGLFDGFGAASTDWSYQLNSCDQDWMRVGLMMSGYTGCWKRCSNWCSDTTTHYYRTDGDDQVGGYKGVAFKENGHRNATYKTLSVGIR